MIIPGHCYESKEGGGMYLTLRYVNSRQWELLVLIEDKRYNHEPAGTIGYANTDWLEIECRRIA